MSYQKLFSLNFGPLNTLTLHAKLYDVFGVQIGATVNSGIVNHSDGSYSYLATLPDAHVGTLVFYDSTNLTRKIRFSVNLSDVTTIMDYAVESDHTVGTILEALYAVIRGKAVANDASDPTQIIYYAPDGTTPRVTHALTNTTRTPS